MPTAYDEGIFQNIVEVGWSTAEPITFEWADDDIGNTGVIWSQVETFATGRPLSQFQKVWPEGSSGSGANVPYDFTNIPNNMLEFSAGVLTGIGRPYPSDSTLASGPWWKQDGTLVANSDRPARGYAFKILNPIPTTWVYRGIIAILPTLSRYYIGVSIGQPAASNDWSIQIRADNGGFETETYPYFVIRTDTTPNRLTDEKTVADSLASQINAGTGASATVIGGPPSTAVELRIAEKVEGYGFQIGTVVGLGVGSQPAIVSFGGLDVDFSFDINETIAVIT